MAYLTKSAKESNIIDPDTAKEFQQEINKIKDDVEDAFDIEIDDDSMEKMLTVKAAMDIILTKLNEK